MVTTGYARTAQTAYFRYLFREHGGIICLARINRNTKEFHEEFFDYSFDKVESVLAWIERWSGSHDIYCAPFFLSEPKRRKETIEPSTAVYADLDLCHPDNLLVQPTFIIQTSPDRYQALWCFDELMDPSTIEDLSRRIAYFHAEQGADKSGWDLTQLLRVPGTYNFKYRTDEGNPTVTVLSVGEPEFDALKNAYPQVKGYEHSDIPLPEEGELPSDIDEILEAHRARLMPVVFTLIEKEPEHDWSKDLWQLENLLYEGGLSREETFVVCRAAACNKYRRDDKPQILLWKEICRAYDKRDAEFALVRQTDLDVAPLLSDEESRCAKGVHTVLDEYVEWAKSIGDAAWQYHQASAFVTLSALIAGRVRLPTSFGTFVPNLWFMILADTTLTRKTTAMDLGMDLLVEIDPDAILATDGSVEGLFQGLSQRPGRPSVFLRDEFSGFLDAMVKKDYLAGLAENMTKLYDGKYQKRILRKETIEVKSPVLILYAGGIKSRVLQLLDFEHVSSGFLPRFVFITAESDISRMQPLGPPTERSLGERDRVRDHFAAIANHYAQSSNLVISGRPVQTARSWEAQLTPDAWARYNKIETDLLQVGLRSQNKELLTPTFDRLAKSGLRAAVLIAAARRLEDEVIVTEEDLVKAFSYVEFWRTFTIEVINGIGRSTSEQMISRVLRFVDSNPGCSRSQIMQQFHLSARDASLYFETMEQRNLVIRQRHGKGERFWSVKG